MIAVSGATGFLGAHVVCRLIKAGKKLRAFKRANSSLREFDFIYRIYFGPTARFQEQELLHWVEADVNDIPSLEEALDGVETVYHCAATVSFLQSEANLMMQVNVTGTANMVNISLIKGVKVFCHVSSIAALGRKKSGDTMDENSKWENSKLNSNYAISKYKAEMEVWRGSEEGLQVCIVNPGMIIGRGYYTKGALSLIGAAQKGMPFYTEGVNGYVDAEDVAEVMYRLVEEKKYGQRYVLVSENMSNRDLFNFLSEKFGKPLPKIKVTKLLAEIAWRFYAIKRIFNPKGLPLTKETARSSLNKSYYNSSKVQVELNFRFKSVQQTLQECVDSFPDFQKHQLS
ncbi:MAG: NAD-dependent epimerase/dehydratase family protein [Bacteroidia bacterium]